MLALFLAAVVGLSLGLLGAGGSILAVPILRYAAGQTMDQAVVSSLATVGAVSLVGGLIAWKEGRVRFREGVQFALLAAGGTLMGARLATVLSDRIQMGLFLLVMVGAIVAMKRSKPDVLADAPPRSWASILAQALGVGALTGLVGVGGGFLIVPALVAIYRLPIKEATGTSLVVIALNSLLGIATFANSMKLDWIFTLEFVASALIGLFLGLAVGRKVESRTVERLFFMALVVVALYTAAREIHLF